jgi:hypothetical protein
MASGLAGRKVSSTLSVPPMVLLLRPRPAIPEFRIFYQTRWELFCAGRKNC